MHNCVRKPAARSQIYFPNDWGTIGNDWGMIGNDWERLGNDWGMIGE